MIITKFVFIFLALVAMLPAQNLDLVKSMCPASTGPANVSKLMAFVPATVTINRVSTVVSTPVCVTLGSTLRLAPTANGGLMLEATTPPPPTVNIPVMRIEKIPLSNTIPATQDELAVTLAKTPAPGTSMLVFLKSSLIGKDTMDAVLSENSNQVVIKLPDYRPFTNDMLVIVYWTLN